MHYMIVSYTYKNTNIDIREKLAFDTPQKNGDFLELLVKNKFIDEAVILSTCNRVEFILYVKDSDKALMYFFEHLSLLIGHSHSDLELKADIYHDDGAIHHLFCVCSSLDSLVIGETQIAGQMKSAFKFSYDRGYCKQNISRAIHFAFRCAAMVRNSTGISKNPVSIASVTASKVRELMLQLSQQKVVVIGLGEMSQISIKHLLNFGASIVLLNRSIEKAQQFLESLNNNSIQDRVEIVSFDKLSEIINHYSLLITATAAQEAIITSDMVISVDFKRFWFDLAVPRDIQLSEHKGIELVSVDDLEDIVSKNLSFREEQANKAYKIIGEYTQQFFSWLQSLHVEPIIKALREQAKQMSEAEIAKAIKKGYLPKEYERNIYKAVHNIFNRFLHTPTIHLKEIAQEPQVDVMIETLKFLFDIERNHFILDQYRCEYDSIT